MITISDRLKTDLAKRTKGIKPGSALTEAGTALCESLNELAGAIIAHEDACTTRPAPVAPPAPQSPLAFTITAERAAMHRKANDAVSETVAAQVPSQWRKTEADEEIPLPADRRPEEIPVASEAEIDLL